MSEAEDVIACCKCKNIPYDILMMSCNHDLCVKCASQRFSSQPVKNFPGKSFLQCEKCKAKTVLDDESALELNKMIKKGNSPIKTKYYEKT